METKTEKLFTGLAVVFFTVFVVALLTGVPVYFLWNWLMPTIFGLPVITFWQALGLSALAGCLFKSASGGSK